MSTTPEKLYSRRSLFTVWAAEENLSDRITLGDGTEVIQTDARRAHRWEVVDTPTPEEQATMDAYEGTWSVVMDRRSFALGTSFWLYSRWAVPTYSFLKMESIQSFRDDLDRKLQSGRIDQSTYSYRNQMLTLGGILSFAGMTLGTINAVWPRPNERDNVYFNEDNSELDMAFDAEDSAPLPEPPLIRTQTSRRNLIKWSVVGLASGIVNRVYGSMFNPNADEDRRGTEARDLILQLEGELQRLGDMRDESRTAGDEVLFLQQVERTKEALRVARSQRWKASVDSAVHWGTLSLGVFGLTRLSWELLRGDKEAAWDVDDTEPADGWDDDFGDRTELPKSGLGFDPVTG